MTCCEAAYLNNRLTFALMKNTPFPGIGILLPLLVLASLAQAQSGANSFPSTGNASVGTSASPNNFTVNGTITTNGTISRATFIGANALAVALVLLGILYYRWHTRTSSGSPTTE